MIYTKIKKELYVNSLNNYLLHLKDTLNEECLIVSNKLRTEWFYNLYALKTIFTSREIIAEELKSDNFDYYCLPSIYRYELIILRNKIATAENKLKAIELASDIIDVDENTLLFMIEFL